MSNNPDRNDSGAERAKPVNRWDVPRVRTLHARLERSTALPREAAADIKRQADALGSQS